MIRFLVCFVFYVVYRNMVNKGDYLVTMRQWIASSTELICIRDILRSDLQHITAYSNRLYYKSVTKHPVTTK